MQILITVDGINDHEHDIEVVDSEETFYYQSGVRQFMFTKFSIRDETGAHFIGESPDRIPASKSTIPETLNEVKFIPAEAYRPIYLPEYTVASINPHCFVKRPDLLDWNGGRHIADTVSREITILEVLKHHPHPNIVRYEGCHVLDGRIDGLCLQKHPISLMEKLNPHRLGKVAFAKQTKLSPLKICEYLSGITEGLKHLHSLGYVHNDIKPDNIMLTEHDEAVIIDFDSCTKIGDSMKGVKRTFGWYDSTKGSNDMAAIQENDIDAVSEIWKWMLGTHRDFKF